MIITKTARTKVISTTLQHYLDKGYVEAKTNHYIEVPVEDLSLGSSAPIEVKCDKCPTIKTITFKRYMYNTKNLTTYYSCCRACSQEKIEATNMEVFGYKNPFQHPDVIKKIEEHHIETYGVKSHNQSDIVKENKLKSVREKYGVDSVMHVQEFKDKIKVTNLERYGVENAMESDLVKERIKNTNLERYGVENVYQSDIIKDRIYKTNMEKYGYKIAILSPDRVEKRRLKYNEAFKEKIKITDPNLKLVNHEKSLHHFYCDNGQDHMFEISGSLLSSRRKNKHIVCTICNDSEDNMRSFGQSEVYKFIQDLYPLSKSCYKYRTVKSKKEIDVFIPELNIGFEYNGLYYHNDKFVKSTYHHDKIDECKKLGIEIYNIWENDWLSKKEICKSIILDKIGKNDKPIINAKECKIKEITLDDINEFLKTNSLNEFKDVINFALGLFYNDILVAIISFENNKKNYKIIDLCYNINYNVLKYREILLDYFIESYKFNKLSILLDFSYENDNFYLNYGFEKLDDFFIDYRWFLNGKLHPKYKTDDNGLLVEYDLYEKRGYKLFDCGHETYSYTKS